MPEARTSTAPAATNSGAGAQAASRPNLAELSAGNAALQHVVMKLETVSRTLSAFQQQRLLEVDKKRIRILDLEGLTRAFEMRVQ